MILFMLDKKPFVMLNKVSEELKLLMPLIFITELLNIELTVMLLTRKLKLIFRLTLILKIKTDKELKLLVKQDQDNTQNMKLEFRPIKTDLLLLMKHLK